MYQQINLIGNIGSEPKLRYTPSGTPVCDFSLAVNKSWTNDKGERQEKTTWFKVTGWRKLAEIMGNYGAVGRKVLVIGEVEISKPFEYNGEWRSTLEVTADTFRLLDSKGESNGNGNGNGNGHASAPTVAQTKARLEEEEIPTF